MDEVDRFCKENPGALLLLLSIRHRVKRIFGPTSSVRVEMVRDPENTRADPVMVLYVVGGGKSLKERMNKLDKFDREWWLEASTKWGGRVTVTLG